MYSLIKPPFAVLSLVLLVGVGSSRASADTISYQLDLGNPAVAAFTGPYVDLLVDRTSLTEATLTFTSLSNGSETFLLGNGSAVAINVDAAIWSVSALSGTNDGIGFTPGPLSDAGSGNVDSFGVFNQRINSFDGFMNTFSEISFVLTNLSASWATAADVLAENANGFVAAGHVFVADCSTAATCNKDDGALTTGFAAVPEPGTALLLGLGLLGLAVRKR